MKTKGEILFIAGYGRSGSTLLDIVLGNAPDHFSVGELINLPVNGIRDNEFCSCGTRIKTCPFWSEVIQEWDKTRTLSLDDYIEIQHRYLRNKKTFSNLWNYYFPSKAYKSLVLDTKSLYDIIFRMSADRIIVDSSKIPQRLLLLRKTGIRLRIIHLYRNFSGVLYSTSKELKKDPEAGVEKTIKPQSFSYVTMTWLWCNILTRIFSIGLLRKSLRYNDFIENPMQALNTIVPQDPDYTKRLQQKGPFTASHLAAGGRVRMKNEMYIQNAIPVNEQMQPPGVKGWIVSILDNIKW